MSRVVLVTGAGRGIGAACAEAFARQGDRVALAARTESEVKAVAARIREAGGEAEAFCCDVADEASVTALFTAIDKHFSRSPTVVVNNAGAIITAPVAALDIAAFDYVMNVNARGTFLCSREAFRRMPGLGGGAIVNVSSLGGIRGTEKFPGMAAYVAAKFAVVGLTEALAAEGRPLGIRVNAIAPGAVDTVMLREAAPHLKTRTKPEDVAPVVVYLADDVRAKTVSGSVVEIFSNL